MAISRRAACAMLLLGPAAIRSTPAFATPNIPSGMIKIIAPFVPGGTADVLARAIAARLGKIYDQSVIVQNIPGSGGNIGAQVAADAKPNGSTLLLGTIGIHAAYSIYKHLPYNPPKDLQPVVVLGGVPCVIAVNLKRPFQTLKQLVDYARKNPKKLTFGSAGYGSSTHMVGELFQQAAGIQLTHIPYKGSAASMSDLLGGQIDMMFELITTAGPIVKAGQIRGLAVTSKDRSPVLPDIPTVSELLVPGFDAAGWFTIATSSKVPEATVEQLNKDINSILRLPELQSTWTNLALNVMGGSPEDGRRFFASETKKWSKVIQTAHLSLG